MHLINKALGDLNSKVPRSHLTILQPGLNMVIMSMVVTKTKTLVRLYSLSYRDYIKWLYGHKKVNRWMKNRRTSRG